MGNDKFVLQWHLTERCNLKCKHCYQEGQSVVQMDYNTCLDILHKYADYVHKKCYRGHINFTGGEVLLIPELLTLLTEECDKLGITYGILTNGTMITKDNVHIFNNMKRLSFVQMSLEGGRKVNDKIRGKGTFKKVFNAVKLLRKQHIKTMISFTCSELNYKELTKLIWICRLHKVDRFWTDRYVPMGEGNLNLCTTEHYRRVIAVLQRENKIKIGGLDVECKRALQGLPFGCGYKCSAGERLLALLPDGGVLPCRRLPLLAGNIQNISFDEALKRCKDRINEVTISSNECHNCIMSDKCNSGAKCLTYAVKGAIFGKDINCWM